MPLSRRRYIPKPKPKFYVKFTGIRMVNVDTGQEVLHAEGEDMVSLITRNLGMTSEAIATREA